MMNIRLHINGLTRYYLKDEKVREEWLKTAVGQQVDLYKLTFNDELKVSAFVGGNQVGNVERSDLRLAGRALEGMECDRLKGLIVDAKQYVLTVDVEVERLAEPKEVVSQLKDWDYTGPLMRLNDDMKMVGIQLKMLKNLFEEGEPDEGVLTSVVARLCELTAYDFSNEAMEERSWLIQKLEALDVKRYAGAIDLLHKTGQQLGGDHVKAEAGSYLKHELPTMLEAQLMVSRTTYTTDREEVLSQARQLPEGLLHLWQTDEVAFARTLYNLKPSREELRRVLSCLIWLDMTQGGESQMTVREVTDYCKDCVGWDEARPVVTMVRSVLKDVLSQEEELLLDEVQEEFRRREKALLDINENMKGAKKSRKVQLTRSDEDIRAALEALMEARDEEGDLLFKNKRQWWAVYRVLTKYCDYPKQMTSFINKMKELELKNVEPSREINYDSLRKTVEDVPKMSCDPSSWLVLKDISPKYQLQYVVADFLMLELELVS